MNETNVSRQEVLHRMMALAAGKANDPVKLAYLPEEDRDRIARLDLGCLTEFKRNSSGTVEMKFVDRTAIFVKILDQLKEEGNDGPAAFLRALDGGGEDQPDWVSRR